jgi:putative ABC transport system substrate-binding protein
MATQRVLKGTMAPPVIAGLILSPEEIKEGTNATGVALEFPLEVQFQWLRRFLPAAGTVGVLYNPKENQRKIDAAARVARVQGFNLEAQEVQAARDLPVALENLSKKAHVLWGVVDDLVLTPQTAKQILLFSFQNRIPPPG